MSEHIILCGLGHAGYRILELLLRLGEPVSLITDRTKAKWKRSVQERGIPLLIGDGTDERLLIEAGIEHAKAIVIATNNDLTNVSIALDAKRLNPRIAVVVRLFDQQLARRLEETSDVRRALSTSAMAAPAFAASALGEEVLSSFTVGETPFVVGRMAVEADSLVNGKTLGQLAGESGLVTLVHARVDDANVNPKLQTPPATGDRLVCLGSIGRWKAFSTASDPRHNARQRQALVAKTAGLLRVLLPSAWLAFAKQMWRGTPLPLRVVFVGLNVISLLSIALFHVALNLSPVDALYFVVTVVTTVGFGDIRLKDAPPALKVYGCFLMLCGAALIATLFSIITDFIIAARFGELLGRHRAGRTGHVVVAGLGNVGYRVVRELLRAKEKVVAIERSAEGEFIEVVRGWIPVIVGDARMEDILTKAGLPEAKALVAATNDAVTNLSIALLATRLNPNTRTVLRMFDADLARKVQESLGVDVVLSTSAVAAPTFVGAALYPDVCVGFLLDDRLVLLLHRKVPADFRWAGSSPWSIGEQESLALLLQKPAASTDFVPLPSQHALQAGDELLAVLTRRLVE